jgi:hypothetical protein
LYEVTLKETEEMKIWREEELKKEVKDEGNREIALKLLELNEPADKVVLVRGLRKSRVDKMKRLASIFGKGRWVGSKLHVKNKYWYWRKCFWATIY